ncbi:hypothetical protein RGAI101_3582 [Roseobacter sp. GAI101]|nr:hypothetical protein RGAI101_3582 [Roseobacter sp. GAI101]
MEVKRLSMARFGLDSDSHTWLTKRQIRETYVKIRMYLRQSVPWLCMWAMQRGQTLSWAQKAAGRR